MNDILSILWRLYLALINESPIEVYSFLLRVNVALICPITLAHIGFMNRWRHPAVQSLLIIFGLLIGLSLPLESIIEMRLLRPWLLPILVTGILFLPHMLAFHCTPHFAAQKKIGFRILIFICVLFVINTIIAFTK